MGGSQMFCAWETLLESKLWTHEVQETNLINIPVIADGGGGP